VVFVVAEAAFNVLGNTPAARMPRFGHRSPDFATSMSCPRIDGVKRCRRTLYSNVEKRVIYDVEYNFDRHDRRESSAAPGHAKRELLFFGDSFTFGSGVGDSHTFPSQVIQFLPDTAVRNFGRHGDAPNDLLRRLEQNTEFQCTDAQAPNRVVVYTYTSVMSERVLGPIMAYRPETRTFTLDKPYYSLDASDQPVYRGTFGSAFGWSTSVYALFAQTQLYERLSRLLLFPRREGIHRIARVLMKAVNLLRERCKVDDVRIVLYPGAPRDLGSELSGTLPVYDLSDVDMKALLDSHHKIKGDGHPSAEAHQMFAKLLSAKLSVPPNE